MIFYSKEIPTLNSSAKMTATEITEARFWELYSEAEPYIEESAAALQSYSLLVYRCQPVPAKIFVFQFFIIEVKVKLDVIKVPPRLHVFMDSEKSTEVIIPYQGAALGGSQKTYVRNLAKKHHLYRQPVDNGGVNGTMDNGETIPIDTLGKWLFGTPGYKGHTIFEYHTEPNSPILCYIPKEAPPEALELLSSL